MRRVRTKEELLFHALSRCDIGDCWEWGGALDKNGYGVVNRKMYGEFYIHRFVWVSLVGPIPDELVLDHRCRNIRCCNPDHLEPVKHRTNILRGVWGSDKCKRGHTDWYTHSNGRRVCNECRRNRDRTKNNRTTLRGPYKRRNSD